MRVLGLLLLLAPWSAASAQRAAQPNIVLFMVDDLGWLDHDLELGGQHAPAERPFRTPNLVRLAAQGVRFSQAYAGAPVCTPTRVSWMTGRSPGALHVTYWTLRSGVDTSAPFPGLEPPAWQIDGLQPGVVTLPGLLRDAGYRTIHVGKAHFGALGTPGRDPRNLGFDVNVAGHAAGAPGSYQGRDNFKGKDPVWDVPGLEAYHGQDVFLTEALAIEAVRAIEGAVEDRQPFFLNFATYAVHTPIQANQRLLASYKDLDAHEAAYATLVESEDAALGAVLDALERLGIADDTLVVFTSDNGGLSAHGRGGEAHTHNAPLRSGKGSAYEGGVRVPLVVRLPGASATARELDTPVITYDLTPTLLSFAGVSVPTAVTDSFEGVDLAPILRGKAALVERSLYWNQPHFWGLQGPGIWPYSAVRRGDWKLIYRHADRGFELYDLAADLGETRNLAAENPERVRALASDLDAWIQRVGAQLSTDAASKAEIEGPLAALAREH